MREYSLAVFIGRFQPFHNSHLDVVRQGLEIADRVLLIVGSNRATLTVKNPFTFSQREDMIKLALTDVSDRVIVEPIRDFYEQDSHWVAEIQNLVARYEKTNDAVCLLGAYKDASSYYVNYFKNVWDFKPSRSNVMMDATDVRNKLFANDPSWSDNVPGEVAEYIKMYYVEPIDTWVDKEKPFGYRYQVNQYREILKYKEKWGVGPHLTGDCVVIQGGHVLLVERKGEIGTGLFALPGGHIKPHERVEAGALRELKEETRIRLDKDILKGSIQAYRMFDHPGRSLLGRVITHAYAIKLRDNNLIEVSGADDAKRALWMSFHDINMNENLFFDDHIHIIRWAWNNVQEK